MNIMQYTSYIGIFRKKTKHYTNFIWKPDIILIRKEDYIFRSLRNSKFKILNNASPRTFIIIYNRILFNIFINNI
ncbi:hypothetical protein BFS26_01640 [Bifidobacterium longum subsp. suis]|uniref:Uncharacterized protein n=1 Tax=Bifidobacterium longum subsp. suis TaxID=1695 RepID=A0A1S2W3W0_BIFLN|nr:hypothetical protein BFS26_01640 [Bifidobacterium longum subsp. suis]